jgi:phosphinothricin acetyltransferase
VSQSPFNIRPAVAGDLQVINAIYNHYIEHTAITFDEQPWSTAQREHWFAQYKHGPYSLLVATCQEQVIGFAYTSPFRSKSAYQRSAEVTIYTDNTIIKGVGTALYKALIMAAERHFHRLYAMIALPNDKSLALHSKCGFQQVGILDDVGYKFGNYHSVAILEKHTS